MKLPDISSEIRSLVETARGYNIPASLNVSGIRTFILISCKFAGKFDAANAKFWGKDPFRPQLGGNRQLRGSSQHLSQIPVPVPNTTMLALVVERNLPLQVILQTYRIKDHLP